jgi:hypothetical protein
MYQEHHEHWSTFLGANPVVHHEVMHACILMISNSQTSISGPGRNCGMQLHATVCRLGRCGFGKLFIDLHSQHE